MENETDASIFRMSFSNPDSSDWNALDDKEKERQINAKKARRIRVRNISKEEEMKERPGKYKIVYSNYFEEGMKELEKLSSEGNIDAQIDLAACKVENEIEVDKNLCFLEKKAGEGNTGALNNLGFLYSGIDNKKGDAYFEKAASLGSVLAMFTLGNHAWIFRDNLSRKELLQAKDYLETAIKKDSSSSLSEMSKEWLSDIINTLNEKK